MSLFSKITSFACLTGLLLSASACRGRSALTSDDIKPAATLVNKLQGRAQAAEVLHILAPLIFAVALARSKDKRKAWTPWLLGVGAELAARQLRDRGLRTTPLEREEWNRRGWAMGWWAMRGAFYENVTKGFLHRTSERLPSLIAGTPRLMGRSRSAPTRTSRMARSATRSSCADATRPTSRPPGPPSWSR